MAKHKQAYGGPELAVIEMRKALARKFAAHAHSEGEHPTAVSGLVLFRHTAPSACHWTTCEPSLSIFVQGRKLISRPAADAGYSPSSAKPARGSRAYQRTSFAIFTSASASVLGQR